MNIGSWSRLLLQVLAFAFCTIIGTLLSDWIDETWIIAVSIGAGLIVASVIGALLEVRKPITHQNKIEGYSKRILFALLCQLGKLVINRFLQETKSTDYLTEP